jgi:predicted secreted protein
MHDPNTEFMQRGKSTQWFVWGCSRRTDRERDNHTAYIQGYSKRSTHFQKFILQELLTPNPCPVYGWKGNFSKSWYRLSEAMHHWSCCMWLAVTSVGSAGLSIWHLPRHTWGSHRVLVRYEKTFESSTFSRHMFNKIFESVQLFLNNPV